MFSYNAVVEVLFFARVIPCNDIVGCYWIEITADFKVGMMS